MHKLSAQNLSFSLPFSFSVVIFIIIFHFLGSVIPWIISQSWFSHSSSTFLTVPSKLCVLHNLSYFHAHVFISQHPLIYSLSNPLMLDPEYTATLLMLQSPPCFDGAYAFQWPSPTCMSDVCPFQLLFLCYNSFCPTLVQYGQENSNDWWISVSINGKIFFFSSASSSLVKLMCCKSLQETEETLAVMFAPRNLQ